MAHDARVPYEARSQEANAATLSFRDAAWSHQAHRFKYYVLGLFGAATALAVVAQLAATLLEDNVPISELARIRVEAISRPVTDATSSSLPHASVVNDASANTMLPGTGMDTEILSGNEPCQVATRVLLAELQRKLGPADPGPIFVGGIGDSGTRGAQQLLSKLGVDMGHYQFPGIPDSAFFTYDSLLYMGDTVVRTCDPETPYRVVKTRHIYGKALQATHTVGYTREGLHNDDVWLRGMQIILNITLRMRDIAQSDLALDPDVLPGLFGFKHPRTGLMLPIIKASLGSSFKFLHIVRDGRDVANGKNQQMFAGLCDMYLNRKCAKSLTDRLEFWASINADITRWATTMLPAAQYHVLRVEDLIDGDMVCLGLVSSFVGVNKTIFAARITKTFVRESFHSHAHSYAGRKWTLAGSEKYTETAAAMPVVKQVMDLFGYAIEARQPWTRSMACVELMPSLRRNAPLIDPFIKS